MCTCMFKFFKINKLHKDFPGKRIFLADNHFVWHYHALIVVIILNLKVDSITSKESRKAESRKLYFRPPSLIPSTLGNYTWTKIFGCKPNKKLSVLLSRIFLVLASV